jgi:hypothetical protein
MYILSKHFPVVAQFMAWICGSSLVGIAGSNPSGARMSVSCEVFYQVQQSQCRVYHTFVGVESSVVCLNVINCKMWCV